MSVGYGRGYYGAGQLARSAPRRKRSWFTIVAVLGVGATVVWLLWPRGPSPELLYDGKEPEPPAPPTPPPPPTPLQVSAPSTTSMITTTNALTTPPPVVGAFLKQLENDALARGFSSVKDYEDSVLASAKELEAAGAKVVLAPHLQHLAPQLES